MLAQYLIPGRTLPLSFVAPPNRDPPQERRAILQRYDATAYHMRMLCGSVSSSAYCTAREVTLERYEFCAAKHITARALSPAGRH